MKNGKAQIPGYNYDKLLRWVMLSLFFLFAFLGFRYQLFLTNYREWGDESETIVAAKMMAAGMKLYSEIFNHHGPLTFLPGMVVEKIGDYGVHGHRVSIALLQIIAVLSIYTSPATNSVSVKIVASAISATIILVFMPDIFGHMYKYQTIVGLLLVIILSQYTIPAIFCHETLGPLRVAFGNILIASLPFLSITYLPIAGLLFLASLRIKYINNVVIGVSVGLLANILFLGFYGSFRGFLAFHLYLNLKILPLYLGLEPGAQLIINSVKTATSDLAHFLSLTILFLTASILASKENHFPWRTLFLVAGLFSLLVRGAGYHGMPYFYAILTMLVPILHAIGANSRASNYTAIGLLLLFTLKISLFLPGDQKKLLSKPIPNETEFSRLVHEFTTKEDRIIAYSFENFEYLVSGRLPASGHFFYLPWQEKYNEDPKFGVSIDACRQIRESAPKIMLIDKWTVWGRYPWSSYADCVQNLLDSSYQQVPDKPYYIRKDLVRGFEDFFISSEARRMLASLPLSEAHPIRLELYKNLIKPNGEKTLIGLGVMFATHNGVNPGVATLILKRANGAAILVDFSLPDLADKRYKHFDLPEDLYTSGEIVALTGGGISAWESHSEEGQVLTCLKFVFSDGSRGFTPGCPMF